MPPETPQLEDGFVRIANELYDAILAAPLSKRELLIVLAVIRKTYGFGKKYDDLTMTQLAELTGLTRAHCSETVRALGQKNVILIRDGEHGKVLALSKNYRNWNFTERPETGTSRNGTRPETGSRGSQNGILSVPKRDPERPETGSTIDNPKRQPQKTTPIGTSSEATLPQKVCEAPAVPATAPTWAAYSDAYRNRYGVEPVRNAKVNGMLAQFVRRVPAAEAPDIAAYYVRHPGAYYVQRMHAVDALLRDAEKLRTEWATGRRTTQAAARQSDRLAKDAEEWEAIAAQYQEAQP